MVSKGWADWPVTGWMSAAFVEEFQAESNKVIQEIEQTAAETRLGWHACDRGIELSALGAIVWFPVIQGKDHRREALFCSESQGREV